MKYHVLYNPKARSNSGLESAKNVAKHLEGAEIEYDDMTAVSDFDEYVRAVPADEKILLVGGDGTLNYYINHTSEETRQRPLSFYAGGTGNDFLNDLGLEHEQVIEDISKYLVKLPTVTVKCKKYLFLNGVGFGIDGYCCEKGDEERAKSDKPVDYTSIAIKGILFHFKHRTATVTVDGRTEVFKNCWLAPTMKGKCYGGGMFPTPAQDRLDPAGTVSVMTYCCKTALKALIVFPSIFKGEHIKNEKVVKIMSGKDITVSFDKPCALQIDGETIKDVTEYRVTV